MYVVDNNVGLRFLSGICDRIFRWSLFQVLWSVGFNSLAYLQYQAGVTACLYVMLRVLSFCLSYCAGFA